MDLFKSVCLFYLMITASICVVGCQNQQVKSQRPVKRNLDLKQAFALACNQIDGVEVREFDLKVRKSLDEWRFTFVFFPKKPGDHVYVIVSKTGVVEIMPGM